MHCLFLFFYKNIVKQITKKIGRAYKSAHAGPKRLPIFFWVRRGLTRPKLLVFFFKTFIFFTFTLIYFK